MFGFLIGTASLIGLVAVLGGGRHGWRHHRWGQQRMLRWLFHHLDTTHGQEKVIRSAVEDLDQGWYGLRDEFQLTREELARAMRSPEFDQALVERIWTRHDAQIATLRDRLAIDLAKIHEALDPRQREHFADLLQSGPRMHRCGWRARHFAAAHRA